MATERIKLTGNSFVTKDRLDNTTFDSSNLYLKSDATGTFKVGGYDRCCVITGRVGDGINNIADSLFKGGYPVYWTNPAKNAYCYTFSCTVPRFHTLTVASSNILAGPFVTGYEISTPISVYLNNTLLTTIRFRIKYWTVGFYEESEGNFVPDMGSTYSGYNTIANSFNVISSTANAPFDSGTLIVEISNLYYAGVSSRYGTIYTAFDKGPFNLLQYNYGGALFSTIENPRTLSLAVTP